MKQIANEIKNLKIGSITYPTVVEWANILNKPDSLTYDNHYHTASFTPSGSVSISPSATVYSITGIGSVPTRSQFTYISSVSGGGSIALETTGDSTLKVLQGVSCSGSGSFTGSSGTITTGSAKY